MASSSSEDDRVPNGGPRGLPTAAAAAAGQAHAEWAASMQQACYAAGGHPYAWPVPQHLMAAGAAAGTAYGAPVPFPVYHPAYYGHASMAAAGTPYMAGEAASAVTEGKSKRNSPVARSGEDASGSGDGGSEGSSKKRGARTDRKGSSSGKRRKSSDANVEGEPSQAGAVQDAVDEPPLVTKGRSTSKLSVSTPGRVALPNATPNLNIGIDLWSTPPSEAVPSGQEEVNAGVLSQCNGAMSQMQDERELKRERRKQSNRESARRSRLRKQQECEELAQKVTDLTTINSTLRSELDQLKKDCQGMEAENSQLMDEMAPFFPRKKNITQDEMAQSKGPSVLTTLSIQIDTSKAHHDNNGKLRDNTNSDSKG